MCLYIVNMDNDMYVDIQDGDWLTVVFVTLLHFPAFEISAI